MPAGSDGETPGQTTLPGVQVELLVSAEQLVVLRAALIGYAIDREQRRAEAMPRPYDDPELAEGRWFTRMRADHERAIAADLSLDVERVLRRIRGE